MTHAKDQEFNKFAELYTDYALKSQPVTASFLGVHDYDEDFTDYSPSGIKKHVKKLDTFKTKLKEIQKRYLSPEKRVDYELIQSKIEMELIFFKKYPLHEILPDLYLNEILFGVYVLVTRDFDSARNRGICVTRRLAQVPNLLRHAKKNVKKPPQVFTESAIHTCQGATMFLETSIVEFAKLIDGTLSDALLEANDEAITALEQFGKYLSEELLENSNGKFATGKVLFNQILKHEHHLPFNSDDLIKIAKKVIRHTENEMKKVAADIDKNKDWREIVEKLKTEHPTVKSLTRSYEKEMKRAKKFVEENDLVTIPEGETIEVVPTPPFAKMLIPYAAYISPAPMEESQKGTFWVTVPDDVSRAEAKQRLQGHSKWGLAVTALHEAYPGHHLQLTTANKHKNLVRSLIETSVFAEGWALYCEEMMYDAGFYTDPEQRLLQLKDNLWRAYRVLIDVGLHTDSMEFEDAVKMLVEKAYLEEPNAEAEVRRYCQSPTQPMSYIIGKHLILELKKIYKKGKGKQFDQKQFHDDLLSHGTIPPAKVADLMELEPNFKA